MRQDKVIDILRGTGKGKRAKLTPVVHVVPTGRDTYGVQYRNKVLEDGFATLEAAKAAAEQRAASLTRATGKEHTVTVDC